MEEINQEKAKSAGYRISPAVIKRLPRYFRYLRELKEAGRMRISSGELSKMMNVTASQIGRTSTASAASVSRATATTSEICMMRSRRS